MFFPHLLTYTQLLLTLSIYRFETRQTRLRCLSFFRSKLSTWQVFYRCHDEIPAPWILHLHESPMFVAWDLDFVCKCFPGYKIMYFGFLPVRLLVCVSVISSYLFKKLILILAPFRKAILNNCSAQPSTHTFFITIAGSFSRCSTLAVSSP